MLLERIDKMNCTLEMKERIYLTMVPVIATLIGLAVCLIIGVAASPAFLTGSYLFCICGYPAVCAWIYAMIRLYRRY